MPSLRRTLSSPPSRRAPYPSSLSSSSSSAATRPAGHVPRRASGSDVSNRRVLADLDWWVVQDGQYDEFDPANDILDTPPILEHDDHPHHHVLAGPALDPIPGVPPPASQQEPRADSTSLFQGPSAPPPVFPDFPLHSLYARDSSEVSLPRSPSRATPRACSLSPLTPFADLSIAPCTPTRIHLDQSSDNEFDSLQSTPESAHFSLLPVPLPSFGSTFMDMGSHLPATHVSPPMLGYGRRPSTGPSGMMRSASYSWVESEMSTMRQRDFEDPFEDVFSPPAPSPFFSLTRTDVDDLFF
ncbi:uncharacterized protein FIBRA_08742 [Fibroporia radiculosa]|uniref:Uncharacterized protein n=1 Tax=Fibroporia radiculosa TaxID=599839 RepID=J4GXC4_9APHY|nr:uncharacterized protein FIBRA_08742 [Fibroporia radiculosa]CCM06475.1 predicted protein [Fibroporia radiculosa]